MNFGELLSGAGRIGSVAREEAQRLRDYERDRTALAEMRRKEAMRESLARRGVPETPPEMLRFGDLDYGFQDVPEVGPAPVPAAPAAAPTAAPAPIEQPITKPLVEPPSLNEEPLTAPGTLSIPREYQGMTAVQLDNLIRDRRRQIRDSTWLKPNDKKQLLAEVAELEKQRDAVGGAAFAAETALIAQSRARIAELEKQRTGGRWGTIPRSARKEIDQLKLDILSAEKRMRDASSVPTKPKAGLDVGASKPAAAVTPEGTDSRFPKPKLSSPPPDFDAARMSDVMEHFESRGNPDARSRADAIGLMQVKPDTAMKPGVEGVNSIFDIALRVSGNPYNVADNKRTKEEAARLLRIPELNKAFGNEYFKGLLAKYDNNVEYALMAYNWGQGNVNKWLNPTDPKIKAADPARVPEETRNYVANIRGAYGDPSFVPSTFAKRDLGLAAPVVTVSDSAPAAELAGVTRSVTSSAPAAPQRVERSAFRAQENAMPEALRQYQQQRAERVQMAKLYQQAGMGAEVQQLRGEIIGMDNDFLRMQGMQGLQEFAYGDPRRLSAVWSAYAGTSVGIQPRSDGMFNLFVGGQRYGEAMSLKQLTDQARRSFDSAYQQRMAEIEAMTYEEGVKSSLRMAEERDKQVATMIKDIYTERAKGNQQQALEMIKQQGFNVQMSNDGSGRFVVQRGGQAYMVDPKAMKPTGPGGMAVEVPVFPIKLPGLR